MTIKDSDWEKYIEDLRKVNDIAAKKMEDYLDLNHDEDGLWNDSDTRANIIDYAYGLSTKYGSAAAELACQMYDAVAKRSGADVPEAEPAETPNYEEVRAGINGSLKQSNRADVAASSVGRQVKKAAVRTIRKNASRDGAQIAWIPQGNETCAFCIMLASRGWMNARSGDYKEHIHQNCDCMLATRFSSDTEYEGYDPEVYLKRYEEAEGDTWKEKLNSMQREFKESEPLIPKKKFTEYSLNPEKDANKAKAFKEALGYDLNNYEKLIRQIRGLVDIDKCTEKGNNEYGVLYEQVMRVIGANEKSANICTAWIKKNGKKRLTLTSAYVTKKKANTL